VREFWGDLHGLRHLDESRAHLGESPWDSGSPLPQTVLDERLPIQHQDVEHKYTHLHTYLQRILCFYEQMMTQ
jgi:hypothetical protein